MISCNKETVYKWSTFLGVFLILFPYGLGLYWGNLYVYTGSYLLNHLRVTRGVQAPWVLTVKTCSTSVTAASAGFISRFVDKRVAVLIGILLTAGGHFLAYFAVQHSLVAFNLVFGGLNGLGGGLVLIFGVQYAADWADTRSGFYVTLCRTGVFFGSTLANQFISLYVNPANERPHKMVGSASFFTQKDILNGVPFVFVYLGIVFLITQVIGFFLLRSKDASKPSSTNNKSGYRALKTDTETSNYYNREESDISQNNCENSSNADTQEVSMTTKEMIKTLPFYVLFFNFTMFNISYLVINTYYKSFGQIYVKDDHLLTNIGSVIPIMTAFTSVGWGIVMDKLGVKHCLMAFSAVPAILGSFYYISPSLNPWLFLFLTIILASTLCSQFSIINISVIKLFGRKHQSNFGVVYLATFGNVFTPFIIESVLVHLGWFYVYLLSAVPNLISLWCFTLLLK